MWMRKASDSIPLGNLAVSWEAMIRATPGVLNRSR
jgi:hypothetical protein